MIDEHDEGEGKRSNLPIFVLAAILVLMIGAASWKVYSGHEVMYVAPDPPPLESSLEEW